MRLAGGFVGVLGFILSPLSWWNDLFVNIPLALGFGWLVSRVHAPLFEPAAIAGYWLTNIAGLILLHKGGASAISGALPKPYTRRALTRDLLISLLYTGIIVALFRLGLISVGFP